MAAVLLEEEVMPTYDYLCKECGRELEEFQSIHDDVITHKRHIKKGCDVEGKNIEHCDGELRRQLSAPMVVWKGGAPTGKHYS
jgi:predicted nucleic acid-binding Zn ribbon protein